MEDQNQNPVSLRHVGFKTAVDQMSFGGEDPDGAYDASKHGVIGLTKAAAKENGKREVRVNAVAPGAIYTPLMEKDWKIHNRAPDAPFDDTAAFGRLGTAEECGNVIVFLLSPESKYVSGSVYSVDGAM